MNRVRTCSKPHKRHVCGEPVAARVQCALNSGWQDCYDLKPLYWELNEAHCRHDILRRPHNIKGYLESILVFKKGCIGQVANSPLLWFNEASTFGQVEQIVNSLPHVCSFRSSTNASHYSNIIRLAWKRLDNLDNGGTWMEWTNSTCGSRTRI